MEISSTSTKSPPDHQNPRRVCFSFAAYAKKVISHLRTCEIHITEGLTDDELSSIENSFGFVFPPDLRSILNEGLPIGPEFPNWRSSSHQQLKILINLPILGICREISKRNLWFRIWGNRPDDPNKALALAKHLLKSAPILIPIYRNYYVPSSPNLVGNPVIFVKDGDLRYSGFNIAGFFHEISECCQIINIAQVSKKVMKCPSTWGGDMKIEFWSELIECSVENQGWRLKLEDKFEEIKRSLKNGGWSDDEVKEMITTTTTKTIDHKSELNVKGRESLKEYLSLLSVRLVCSGWSREDALYSLGFIREEEEDGIVVPYANSNGSGL
ncbi:hypothetical protein MKW98_032142 [Papaver atlanticum]|uniref:Knr4/Smi1-like domain-containing protein n=1 Tax=Papaver atlanticum TaxID=357466 RepID=A0AAD4SEM8_9MAGN|nr:hypothetical protein MKW98_032142 [Papaver atlanticum]